jgi:murein DD-endopeptidase MepM/ murein hydrolase activator NlpD
LNVRAVAAVVVVAGLTIWALTQVSGDESQDQGPVSAAQQGAAPTQAEPSSRARRLFEPGLLDLYMSSAAEQDLDWTIVAAVDRLEGGEESAVSASERVLGIALELNGFGAPDDYRAALEARGLSSGFVDRAFALAESLQSEPGLANVPATHDGFGLPVEGTVVAGYGSRFGAVHDGVDIEAPEGREIHAVAAGLVTSVGFSSLRGNQTCLAHRLDPAVEGRGSVQSCYGNQSQIIVEPGDRVAAGETIGLVGCSGPCLRPHTHFRVLAGNGDAAPAVDPQPFFSDSVGDVSQLGQPLE